MIVLPADVVFACMQGDTGISLVVEGCEIARCGVVWKDGRRPPSVISRVLFCVPVCGGDGYFGLECAICIDYMNLPVGASALLPLTNIYWRHSCRVTRSAEKVLGSITGRRRAHGGSGGSFRIQVI